MNEMWDVLIATVGTVLMTDGRDHLDPRHPPPALV